MTNQKEEAEQKRKLELKEIKEALEEMKRHVTKDKNICNEINNKN